MKFRLKLFAIHLVVSSIMALVAVAFVFWLWYPSPLDTALGVTSIFFVLLGVDIVIGPLCTLLVSKQGKKTLKSDLLIIVLLQLSAFLYGFYVVFAGRPVWIVFNVDRFDLVQAYEIQDQYRAKAAEEFQMLSFFGPRFAAAKEPEGALEHNEVLFDSLSGGMDIPQRPNLFVSLESERESIKNTSIPLSNLNKFNSSGMVEEVLKLWPEANAYLPLMAKVSPMSVLINKETGDVVAIVPLAPWVQ
jgi:hypothetical protein